MKKHFGLAVLVMTGLVANFAVAQESTGDVSVAESAIIEAPVEGATETAAPAATTIEGCPEGGCGQSTAAPVVYGTPIETYSTGEYAMPVQYSDCSSCGSTVMPTYSEPIVQSQPIIQSAPMMSYDSGCGSCGGCGSAAPPMASPVIASSDCGCQPSLASTVSYSAPVSYETPVSYSAPISYETPMTTAAPISYEAPVSYASDCGCSQPVVSDCGGCGQMAYNSYPTEIAPVSYESTGCGGCGDCGCGTASSFPVEGGYIVEGATIQGCTGGDCGGTVVMESGDAPADPVEAPATDGEEAPSEDAPADDDDKKEA